MSYSDADLARFAEFAEHRAKYRPPACTGGPSCWVEQGPPAMPRSRCLGCDGIPKGFELGRPLRLSRYPSPIR